MVTPRIEIAPERIAEGKRLYDLTLTRVADIATMMGISRRTLVRRMREWGWPPRSAPRHATDRMLVATAPHGAANAAMGIAVPLSAEARAALAARIHGIVARSLDAVERVLALAGPADEVGAERSARTIAAVARTLTDLAVFAKPDETRPNDADDHDPIPRDIDAVREALAVRIEAFIESERRGEGTAVPDAGDASRAERA